jgi:hypothetical protein
MHHLRALISESPEELPKAFLKEFKNFNSDHKVKVWSRKDPLALDYDFYFLSHRDYVQLKKNKQLPLGDKIILLATNLSIDSAFAESEGEKICGFIAGGEEDRGRLAAEFFIHLCKMSQGLLPHKVETQTQMSMVDGLALPPWLKEKIHQSLIELFAWNKRVEFNFELNDKEDEVHILAELEGELPPIDLFGHTFHQTHLNGTNQEALKSLALKSLFHLATETIIFKGRGDKILFELKFKKTKAQKKYESLPKLFGLNQLKAQHV